MVNIDLGSMPNKYKNFNSLEDFIKTIDYLEEKLKSDRGHKGDLKQKIERVRSFAITYMEDLRNGRKKASPADLKENGNKFLSKFGPDKNGKNYSTSAIKFKDWIAKQPLLEVSEKISQKERTTPKKTNWFRRTVNYFKNRNNFDINVAAGVLVGGSVLGGALACQYTGALTFGAFASAALTSGAIIGGTMVAGLAAYGLYKGAKKLGGALRKKISKFYNKQKDKSHSGLKMALQLGAISTVMIGASVATLNPAIGLGMAAAYGAGATVALGIAGAGVVGLAKGIEKIGDYFADKKMAKIMKDIEQQQSQHQETERRKQEMLKRNQDRKRAHISKENEHDQGTARIVEMYPNGNPYQETDENTPMRDMPDLVQMAINNRKKQKN